MLPCFPMRHPKVDVVLKAESPQVALPATGADIMIRVGLLADSTMVARRLTTVELWTCASPAYLAIRGAPSRVAEFAAHDVVGLVEHRMHWLFHDAEGRPEEVKLHPRAVVPDMAVARVMLAGGAGIGQLPDFMIRDAIGRGELTHVLSDMRPATADLHLLYFSHHGLSAKVQVFIDTLIL